MAQQVVPEPKEHKAIPNGIRAPHHLNLPVRNAHIDPYCKTLMIVDGPIVVPRQAGADYF